ncbi:MAG: nucleotide pyrophosphohydrolase [Prevotella sp.]|nr:nucleotide pyrophosphohydrolase [Prevotella sp.]
MDKICEHSNDTISIIKEALKAFNRERDWEQFHDSKNLALSISIEASELNECFLWKNADEADIEKVEEELADVFLCAIMLADKYDFNIKEICLKKIERNAQKYPVEKAKGKAKKYNEL